VVEYLEELLALDAREFGMEMFEASSDVSGMTAEEIIGRDAKEYEVGGGRRIEIAQIETVGAALADRHAELREALEARRRQRDYALVALMLTNIVDRGSELLVAGDTLAVERSFGKSATNGAIPLPGVMSRKKQVAPKLLAAL